MTTDSTNKQKPASTLTKKQLPNFKKSEFPRGTMNNVSADHLLKIQAFRTELGVPLIPSPVTEGWFRKTGSETSRHYAAGRLSDAGDLFLSADTDARTAFLLACQHFNGVGIYYDTQISGEPRIMLHLDSREVPVTWCRHKGEYLFPARGGRDADVFFYLLNKGVPQP